MKKSDLKQLKKLMSEKADLEQRMKRQAFSPKEEVADTVKDYRTGFGKTIVIRGYGDEEWKKIRDKWYVKLLNVSYRIQQMEKFLDDVEDAEMRQILRLRYQDGLSQEEVGEVMGYSRQAVQKKEERFWKSL